MTTTMFLVRHAAHDLLGKILTGRMAGVRLGPTGQRQAEQLADRLSREAIGAIYTSPLERARETAAPLARRLGIEAVVCEAATDIDFGEWSGMSFQALDREPLWARWNAERAAHCPPGGETMQHVQARAVAEVARIAADHRDSGAVLVSHCDVIKAILAYYLGLGWDSLARFEVSPASISTLIVGEWGAKVHSINEVAAG